MNHHEDDEQRALFQWAGYFKILRWMHAIPNGGGRNKKEAARLIGQGVKKGVLDIFLPLPVYERAGLELIYYGLYIEMKRTKAQGPSSVSAAQAEFAAEMLSQGYQVKFCYGAREAITAIKEYCRIDPTITAFTQK